MPSGLRGSNQVIADCPNSDESDIEFIDAEEKPYEGRKSRSRVKQWSHYPRPHSHCSTKAPPRSNKHTRRYENSLYLKTLYQISEEELDEDYNHFIPKYHSSFQDVLIDNHHLQLWQTFTELSDDQQQLILGKKDKSQCVKKCKSIADTKTSFTKIDSRLQRVLSCSKRLPLEFMESMEAELQDQFQDDSTCIIILLNLTSYQRMLIHAICQYNNYYSTTCYFDDGKSYITIHCENFIQPPVQLFKFLQR